MERTKVGRKKPEHVIFADLVSQSCLVGYEFRQFPRTLAVLAALKKSRLPLALGNEDFESRKLFISAFRRSAARPEQYKARGYLTVKAVKLLGELVCVCEAFQYAKERAGGLGRDKFLENSGVNVRARGRCGIFLRN